MNATVVKELFYNAAVTDPTATTLNFTVENCHVNAYIEKIVFSFASADASFVNQVTIDILDRGNAYPSLINGMMPVTYASFGVGQSVQGGTLVTPIISQKSSTVAVAYVNQSVQDSEGLGNIYVKLTRINGGVFNINFTMAVFYKPETTYNPLLTSRNQISNNKPIRVITQTGTGAYTGVGFTDQTNYIAHHYNPRNNITQATFGFNLTATDPIFYFGTPFKTKRWFIGFSSDNTPQIGLVTFSYFNGTNFVDFTAGEVFIGASGPSTFRFKNDGVIIFSPPTTWSPLNISNDPLSLYNTTMAGLGTMATNNVVNNPPMYWIKCRVGLGAGFTAKISTVVPLIDPEEPLTNRRRLI